MKRSMLLLATAGAIGACGPSNAAVLVRTPAGQSFTKPDLVSANTAADVAGNAVIVTGSETVPRNFVWREDARLVVEKGSTIRVEGGPSLPGPLETGPVKIVTGGATITKPLPTAIGTPPAASTLRVDTINDAATSIDRNFGLVSQIVTGTDVPFTGAADPQSDAVAGYFVGYKGEHAANFVTTLNPVLMSAIPDKGVVTTSGTAVTLKSGAPFRPEWVNSVLLINNVIYKIASVESVSHLTLRTSAGNQSGAPYEAGAGGNAMEVDVNSPEDIPPNYGGGYGGIVVGSGGAAKPLTGISVSATNSPTNAWQYGEMIAHYLAYGLLIHAPASTGANGAYINNGAAGSTTVNGGNPALVLTGADRNLLRLTPSSDNPSQVIAYGTNAANNAVRWSITQGGNGTFSSLTVTNLPVFADNAAARAGGLQKDQVYRTPAGALMVVYQ